MNDQKIRQNLIKVFTYLLIQLFIMNHHYLKGIILVVREMQSVKQYFLPSMNF